MHFWVACSASKRNDVEIHIFQLLLLHSEKNKLIRIEAELSFPSNSISPAVIFFLKNTSTKAQQNTL